MTAAAPTLFAGLLVPAAWVAGAPAPGRSAATARAGRAGVAAASPTQAASPSRVGDEALYYKVDFLPTPAGAIEVGGLGFLPDGRLVVSTRRGQVWIVEDPCAPDPAAAKLKLFAEGLYEGLGLEVVDGDVYVLQRTELSRLLDSDGDGRCDTIDTIASDWGISGNYHEFAYGLPRDEAGSFFIALNVSFFDPQWWHGKSPAKWRGWVLKVTRGGEVLPFASGFRSPNGLGFNADGDLFVTDNQGDWMPCCPLFHVKKGEWYGHPASLEWTDEYLSRQRKASDTEPPPRPRAPPAVWIPYGLARSAGNPLLDSTGGKFGPFAGQMFIAELTNGCVLRADLERIEGEWQGAVMQFRRDTGSANRIRFAPDGTLFVGLTNRGWGGAPPADGIARVRFTGRVPMELKTVRLLSDGAGNGFELGFTLPIANGEASGGSRGGPRDEGPRGGEPGTGAAARGSVEVISAAAGPLDAISTSSVGIVQYDYHSWWDYGCPEMHVTPVGVTAVELSADRTKLKVRAPGLRAGMCARIVLSGIAGVGPHGEEPLLHPQADYTIHRLPGMKDPVPVAKVVEPPSAREDREEGWVTFFDRRSIEGFDAPGWKLAAVHMDPADATRLAEHPLVDEWDGMLVSPGGVQDAVSRFLHGDCDSRVEFMVPRGSNSGIYFQGRYEVQVLDSFGKKEVGSGDCGGIYEGRDEQGGGFPGSAPRLNASNAPGEWQRFDVRFRAPRFDAAGRKIASARFDWVKLNGELIQENVEVGNPTRGGFGGPEVAHGPLRLQGDHGPVAYKKVRLKRIEPEGAQPGAASAGWARIFDGKTLDGWKSTGDARWSVEEDAIVGRGPAGHLFSPRGDYKDYEQRARVRINEKGNSGFYGRTAFGPGWPQGYEAQINASHEDPQRTGSLYGFVPVRIAPVREDQWFELRVRFVDEAAGTHVTVFVNDVITADFVDAERRHASGHVALQQHNEGSEVRFRDVEVRELR